MLSLTRKVLVPARTPLFETKHFTRSQKSLLDMRPLFVTPLSLLNRVRCVPCVPFNLLVPSCPKFRRALVPSMLACPRALVPACPNFRRALVPSMLACPRALVPTCLQCWRALVPSCLRAQIFGVPSCLCCFKTMDNI